MRKNHYIWLLLFCFAPTISRADVVPFVHTSIAANLVNTGTDYTVDAKYQFFTMRIDNTHWKIGVHNLYERAEAFKIVHTDSPDITINVVFKPAPQNTRTMNPQAVFESFTNYTINESTQKCKNAGYEYDYSVEQEKDDAITFYYICGNRVNYGYERLMATEAGYYQINYNISNPAFNDQTIIDEAKAALDSIVAYTF